MTIVDLLGWTGTLVGTVLGLPQLVRLFRTRNVHGLSIIAWQAMLAVNVGWTVHGLRIGQAPQWVTSVLSLVATVPILYLISKELRRNFLLVLVPGLAAAVAMTVVDQLYGSAAYGVAAILPAVISNAGQSVALIRARDIRGVAPAFLGLALLNQCVWVTWAILVPDPGTIIAAITTGSISLFNVAWYALRRFGLRHFFEKRDQPVVSST